MTEATILPPSRTSEEAQSLLVELSRLQTWCIMQMRHDPRAASAADLVQRTRIFIIEQGQERP